MCVGKLNGAGYIWLLSPPPPATHTHKSAAGRLSCRMHADKNMLTCELHVAPGLRPARVGLCLAPDVLDLQEWAHSHKHAWVA